MQSSTLPASSLTYLRTLNQVHVMTQKLFIFIVSFGNTNLKGSTPTENTTTSAALSKASSGNIFQPNNAEMTTVHKHLSDLFAQYLEGGRYLEREHAFIKSVVNAICAPYAQVSFQHRGLDDRLSSSSGSTGGERKSPCEQDHCASPSEYLLASRISSRFTRARQQDRKSIYVTRILCP